ncbi:MAG: DUF3021 family protein [Defluviitaleaceae bacterium]|nr:DUF3021 family protein [Defluviitaleaceae bacterium]
MDKKEIIKEIMESFFVIFTVAIIVNGIIAYIGDVGTLPIRFVFDILLLSFFSSLAGLVLYSKREMKRGEMIFRYVLHFIIISAIALGFATYMQWVNWQTPSTVIAFAIVVIAIYITTHAVVFIQMIYLTGELNKKLKERYKN